ncbi:hypothetical protein C0J52_27902 [Blattella germanica]|nr:hypothetical protein C0J52_27902 [Blattella germanica]
MYFICIYFLFLQQYIAGQWYLRASSDYVFNHGRNFSASAEIQNGAVKWHGNGIKVKSTIEEHEYNALWTFPDEHSPEYTAKLEGILSVFSGNYTVVNMDAECFIFIQGCPKQFDRVSYNNQKLRLRWSEDGVTLNPELKLLQYNVGQPLELMETTGYVVEREGKNFFLFSKQLVDE